MNYGIKIVLEAGNVISKEEIATNIGTTIIVTNLFFNTPVRYKFLKKELNVIDKHIKDKIKIKLNECTDKYLISSIKELLNN